jgi:hypothetical protein
MPFFEYNQKNKNDSQVCSGNEIELMTFILSL